MVFCHCLLFIRQSVVWLIHHDSTAHGTNPGEGPGTLIVRSEDIWLERGLVTSFLGEMRHKYDSREVFSGQLIVLVFWSQTPRVVAMILGKLPGRSCDEDIVCRYDIILLFVCLYPPAADW